MVYENTAVSGWAPDSAVFGLEGCGLGVEQLKRGREVVVIEAHLEH